MIALAYAFLLGVFSPKKALPVLWSKSSKGRGLKYRSLTRFLLLSFLVFQLLFPWRYLMYPSDLFWKEEGYRFSWRVKRMEKSGSATFYLKKAPEGKKLCIDNREFLTHYQEKQMATQPDLIYQYADLLEEHFRERGADDPIICSEIWVTLNGRPSALYFPKDFDLSGVYSYAEFLGSMLEKPMEE
jgi:hypothetical protein